MSNLSEEALHNLCYSALSFADNLFQMWLTVTFGAILATSPRLFFPLSLSLTRISKMNVHRLLPLGLASIVFLLPLIVAAQTDQSDDSVTLTAHDPETGVDLPTPDRKASIEGTPGDGVRDSFNYGVTITNTIGDEPGRLKIQVMAFDDNEAQWAEEGVDVIEEIAVGEDRAIMFGRIDLSSDTELGQVLRYLGRVDLPNGRAATFQHDVTVGCLCPRAGSWTASNYPGTMVCTGTVGFTLPLAASTQKGTLGVDNGCQSLQITNFDDEYADVPMQRVPGECGYKGEAEGVPLESRFTMDVQNEEFIIGSLRMEIDQQGTTCIMTRNFEVRYND